MRSRVYAFLVVVLVLSLFGSLSVGQASPTGQSGPAPLKLKAATFAPAAGEAPVVPPGLASAAYAEGQRGYYIVQFRGPVEQTWKDQVVAAGAELLDYLPEFAFKARMTPAEARRVAGLSSVASVIPFQPAFKLSPDLVREGTNLYRVRVERGADFGLARAAIAGAGAQVLAAEDGILLVAAQGDQLEAIAQVLDVAWVENFRLWEKHNEYGGGVILGANAAGVLGYDGASQTVAVADTGLGRGTANTAHSDIAAGRIAAIYDWAAKSARFCYRAYPDGPQDVDSGHGTHTAVSAVGDGDANGVGKGTAPAAKLVFQAVEDYADMYGACASYADGYYLLGIPADLRQLFGQAYIAGARIHSNSWGSDAAGDYTLDSANTDDFIWQQKDMTITFSAGNAGPQLGTVGSPATAKNVIAVGASENDRQGHYECDSTAYPGCQNTPGDRAGNREQMADFSSRGPTDDGRIKPDVVAPGTWVLSGYSDMYQQGYDSSPNPRNGAWQWLGWGYPLSSTYKYMGGTSMANPLVAGGAAVVRDFYQERYGHSASAALVKATLINSAVDLLDENNDGQNDNDYPIPNPHEGWGRVNLAAATDGSRVFVDEATGLATNGTATYSYTANGGPLKVTLVWSDYPSTEAAANNLVNDLDLTVTGPDGTVYRGNVFAGGWSQSGGSADRVNNVENVYIQSAAGGSTWKVEVKGYNVPNGPQPFALVVNGASGGVTPSPTPTPTAALHVGDLDGSATASKSGWKASVAITVHDGSHNPVGSATVSGSWSGGYTGSATCTTYSDGTCTVATGNINKKRTSVTFTVSGVTKAGYTYDSSANHDVDDDSNGTTITVSKP